MTRKATMSVTESKKVILKEMVKQAKGKVEEKTFDFSNDDVSSFLKGLNEFEQESKKTIIVAK